MMGPNTNTEDDPPLWPCDAAEANGVGCAMAAGIPAVGGGVPDTAGLISTSCWCVVVAAGAALIVHKQERWGGDDLRNTQTHTASQRNTQQQAFRYG